MLHHPRKKNINLIEDTCKSLEGWMRVREVIAGGVGRGRPKRTYHKVVQDDLWIVGLNREAAQDQTEKKASCRRTRPTRACMYGAFRSELR